MSSRRQRSAILPALAGQARELGVEEGHVEGRVVDHQLGAIDELEQVVRNLGEARLVGEELVGDAVHFQRTGIDVAVGADVMVQPAAGAAPVLQLDAADLDDAMPEFRFEAGGLGVQDDLADHQATASTSAATTCRWVASSR